MNVALAVVHVSVDDCRTRGANFSNPTRLSLWLIFSQ